ncbi:hypothetical protein GGS23DRAFT_558960 [Durotheca rogersii]|uniref:uncharacterized protein n=1 Tax=Durotheca rogersii TaxID=419775 RepID=UPI00222114AE|nr:uncharacterized protein GGS23DRAFT_558960 [Durotheca rogersii]KAI5865377.1 hypothetical protein GGS23DRAFT_558960 [Durotheca rogersii]
MFFFSLRKKTYEKHAEPLGDAESRERLMTDVELDHSSSRASEETVMPAASWQRRSHRARLYTTLSCSLVITNIVTFGLWLSSLHRMNSWLMEDYYNRPEIEHLGQAQVPVEYETRKFHTGIVAGDVTEFFGPPGSKADVAWNKIVEAGLTRLTADQAGRLGEVTAKEWNTTDSYVGVLGAIHQLHCLSRLRYTIFYPGRFEEFDGGHLAQLHLLHCIEYLREIIMCLGDVTVEPVGWNTTTLTYIAEKDQVRQCRRFDKIYDWATEAANEVPNAPGNVKAWKDMLDFEGTHPVDHKGEGS